jgi:ribose transport system substrate-binding protein
MSSAICGSGIRELSVELARAAGKSGGAVELAMAGSARDRRNWEESKVEFHRTPLKLTAIAVALAALIAAVPVSLASAAESTMVGSIDISGWLPSHPDAKVMVDTSKFKKDPPFTIGYSDASQSNSWRIMAKAAVEWGISKSDGKAKLAYTNANDNAGKQIADIEDLLTQHVDAIILAATDVNALCPSIAKAEAQGVPVIILERMVNCPGFTQFIDDRNSENGIIQAAYVADKLKGEGNVVIIGGIQGSGATVESVKAIEKVFANYPGIKILATEYAEYQPAKCKQIMSALLTRYPKIDAVISISGNQGVGCYDAFKEAGRVKDVKAWTGDDANGWMKIVATEKIPSVITPIPTYAGMYAVEEAVKILSGEPVPKDFLVPKPQITADNIDQYAKLDRPDEWWYPAGLPCEFDPYCKK